MKIQWDFEKILLAVMGVLILTGLGLRFYWSNDLAGLKQRLPRAENQLADIGKWSYEIDELDRVIADEPFAQGIQGFEYLETQMVQSRIGKKFRIDLRDGDQTAVYQDRIYTLRPREAREDFTREAIARFLLFVEANTRRMTVTRVRLELSSRRGASDDAWKPIIEVTDREPVKG